MLQRFASVYRKVVFLHFFAESNEMTKYLDQVKLKVERHPHFAFFRKGKLQGPPSCQVAAGHMTFACV